MTYLCSLGTETAIFSVSLLTKKPFFWQVYFITSVLVFGMSHNIMFLLCVTKGQKILFLFKEVEKLSSVCILKDERVRKYCFCSMKLKRFSSILYDWMMIDRTHNWLRSFLKEYAYFYARLWNIKNYEVIPKQKRIIFRMILISDYECSSRIIYWFIDLSDVPLSGSSRLSRLLSLLNNIYKITLMCTKHLCLVSQILWGLQ